MVIAATTPALPALPKEDRRRLTRFFALNESLAALADELNRDLNAEDTENAEDQIQEHSDSDSLSSSDSPRPLRPLRSKQSAPSSDPLRSKNSETDEFELQTWATRPDIAAHIDFRRAESDRRARQNALTHLEQILKLSQDLIEKRRAASAILRTLNHAGAAPSTNSPRRVSRGVPAPVGPSEPRPSGNGHHRPRDETDLADDAEDDIDDSEDSGLRTEDSGLSSSPHLPISPSPNPSPTDIPSAYSHKPGDIQSPPTPLPDPRRTPQDLVNLITQAIQQPNLPERHTGPFTLFNLAGSIEDRSPDNYINYRHNYLKNTIGNAWEFASLNQRWLRLRPINLNLVPPFREDHAYALIELTLKDSSTRRLQITLRRESKGVLKDCWLLRHLVIHSKPVKSPYRDDPFNDTS